MFDLALTFGSQPLPPGRRVGIVTNSGGPGILCADACEASGLTVPEFSGPLRARLAGFLPAAAGTGNPVDLIASAGPEQYRLAVGEVLTSGEIDALVVIHTTVVPAETEPVTRAVTQAVATARGAGGGGRPVLACVLAEPNFRSGLDTGAERIPCYAFPETAGRVLGKVAAYAGWRAQPPDVFPDFDDLDFPTAREICRSALACRGPGWLSAGEVHVVLQAAGLPLLPSGVARTADEAAELAERLGFPAAVKLASRRLVHKTDVGGVRLRLADAGAVRRAFGEIRDRLTELGQLDALEGVVVQPMAPDGVEVMAGVTQDRLFGPLVAFGLGGVTVEAVAGVDFRVAPLSGRDAAEMVRGIRALPLLTGYRGQPAVDLAALEEVLLRVSRLAEEIPEVGEVDMNPIFAHPAGHGCTVADARVYVRPVVGQ
jgi:acetate---CoA ligase (ADP-forming)